MTRFDHRSHRQRESPDPVARYLGELQAKVMGIYWDRENGTVREVVEQINKRRKRKLAYTTVLTLVSRLWSRGLLLREAEGRGFRYRAAQTRDEFLAELSDELIDRLLHDFGEIAVARFDARVESLDNERLTELREAKRR